MFFFSPTLVGHLLYRGIVHLAVSWCGRAMRSCLLFPGGLVSVVRSNGEDGLCGRCEYNRERTEIAH